MKVFLIRHGETDYNRENRMMGHMNVPLNDLGRSQAERTGEYLKKYEFSAIYSSDLKRAMETSEIIKQTCNWSQVIIPKQGLRELRLGKLEGVAWTEELDKYTPEEFNNYLKQMGGETFETFYERVWHCFQEIINNHKNNEQILLIAHGGTIRVILTKILQPKENIFNKLALENGSITILNIQKSDQEIKYRIERVNFVCDA